MNRFKNHLIVAAALSLLAAIGTFMNSNQAAAQGPPDGLAVKIVNPVPVPVTGSTTVSGAVAATQSGAWNVGILGSPNVTVANPSGNPVQVRDVNEASQPVAAPGGSPFPGGTNFVVLPLYTVPAGKRLVIEYFSGECFLPAGQTAVASVRYPSGILLQHWLTASPPATGPAGPFSTITSFGGPLRAYVDPGSLVEAIVVTNANVTDQSRCNATISGHLVNVP
jgi:hypothetical protein